MFDWSRVLFVENPKRPWTTDEAVAFARRVEEIALEEREKAEAGDVDE